MPLTAITDGLWELVHDVRLPGGARLPVRMTVARLAGGALALHSPVPITDADADAIAAHGEVAHVIAPSRLHHLWLAPAAARYPRASVWLAPSLVERYAALRPAGTLGDPGAPWRDDLAPVAIEGAPKVDETVFFHAATRTLVCTNLLFHITRPPNRRTSLVLRMMGTRGRFAVSRAWRLYTKDRARARASLERVLAWDARRVVMGHGDVFEGDVRAAIAAGSPHRLAGRAALGARSG